MAGKGESIARGRAPSRGVALMREAIDWDVGEISGRKYDRV